MSSLEQQTVRDFNVIVVNDGSTDAKSIEVFSEMETLYQSKGWRFITKENSGPSSTRNFAAFQGQAKYICFIDADNVAALNLIERLSSSIRISGDDCLTCYLYAFEGDSFPYRGSAVTVPAHHLYMPLGNAPEVGLFSNTLGDATMIIRRGVFQKLGGFSAHRLDRYLDREDYELLARLSLQGYSFDVVPEYLCFYRHRSDSLLHTTNYYQGEMRVLRVFKKHLQQVGLGFLVPLIRGLSLETGQQPAIIEALNDSRWLARRVTWRNLCKALIQKGVDRLQRR